MKNRKITVFLVLAICLLVILSSCGSSKLSGNWICQEGHGGYPEQMTLKDDGTGIVDGYSCSWTASDGIITFNIAGFFSSSEEYEYELKGSTLYLDGYGYDKQ